MKRAGTSVLLAIVFGFGVTPYAKADNTFIIIALIRVAPPPPRLVALFIGKICVAVNVKVQNTSDDTIHVTLKDGDGTVLIDEDVTAGSDSSSATFNNIGTGEICLSHATLPTVCSDIEITPSCYIIPTLSQWGICAMVLLLLTAGSIVFGRRRYAVLAKAEACK